MFEYLSGYRVILTSGPHRAGTTICAKIIAHDTGLRFCPEETFGHDNVEAWWALVKSAQGAVIQCPTMCYCLDEFREADDVAVVMVRRNMADVLRSQRLVGWSLDGFYHERYKRELRHYTYDDGELAVAKYQRWDAWQRNAMRHVYDVQYEFLCDHPLWIPKAERVGFAHRQTSPTSGGVSR